MRRSKSKTPSADAKNKRGSSGPRVDWVPPHPALGAQVNYKRKELLSLHIIVSFVNSY